MGAAGNKALVQRVIAAYAQSDIDPFLESISEDFIWTSTAPEDFYGFGGRHLGRAGALAVVSKIATEYQLNAYDVVELVGEGEIVWMTANVVFTYRRSGIGQEFKLVSRWHVRNGRILALTEYFDSASLLLKEGRLVAAA